MPTATSHLPLALVLLIAVTACAGDPESGPKSEDSVAPAAMTAVAGGLAASSAGLKVSTADLPDFAELPPDAKAIHNMKLDDGGKIGGTVSLEVRQSPAELLAFYKQVFARHGLKIGVETLSDDVAMLNGQSADEARMLYVMINTTDDGVSALNIVHARTAP